MIKKYEIIRKIIMVVAAIVTYTFFVILVMCGIMEQCNLTHEDIMNIDIPGPVFKGIAILVIIVIAIIGIPGKKRNIGY